MCHPRISEIVIIPGSYASPEDNWYQEAQYSLQQCLDGRDIEVIVAEMPRILGAKQWLNRTRALKLSRHSIVAGHSTGALMALLDAEENPLGGTVLVAAHYTHCGHPGEKASGLYTKRGLNWDRIKKNNLRGITQFGSDNDDLIPHDETLYIQKMLDTNYIEIANRGHYTGFAFPELPATIEDMLK